MKRPEIERWRFVRISDGKPISRRKSTEILKQAKAAGRLETGSFEEGGISISGLEKVEDLDESHLLIRNRVALIKVTPNNDFIIVLDNYNEYSIRADKMDNYPEAFPPHNLIWGMA